MKALIHHLPELLAGSLPVLRRPAVLSYLKTDPDASSAILAVAHAACTMRAASEWMRSLPRHSIARLTRSVETARKHFRKELVDLMFDVALSDFEQASESLGLALDRKATANRTGPTPDLRQVTGQLAEALGLPALPRTAPDRNPSQPLARAEQLMAACDETTPNLIGVRFYRLFLPQLRTGTTDSRAWMRYIHDALTPADKYTGLCRASRAYLIEDNLPRALETADRAGQYAPHSSFPPYSTALLHGLMNATRPMTHHLNRWLDRIGPFPSRAQLGARQVRSDHKLWHKLLSRTPDAIDAIGRIHSRLPQPIAQAFAEVSHS